MKLYIYDHCPYCVKARMVFGFKNIEIPLVTLLNDDEETPIKMIGQKMVPILEKEDGTFMPESMDIINYIDQNVEEKAIEELQNPRLDKWLEEIKASSRPLTFPRWAKAPLAEFKTQSAIDYFVKKKEAMIGNFDEHIKNSKELIKIANEKLEDLANIIKAPDAVCGKLSYYDFHLFAALRSLSIVKGIKYPDQVEIYRKVISDFSGVPLHDSIAL